MPSTVNGVGTHYYGKKNLQTRPGTCPHCRSQVNLASYDTMLWFVVVFIPVIPLGRKRIIDACPACRRHYVASLQKWEAAKQLEISGALEKYRSNPTPEAAIDAHRQLMTYHQAAEAAGLQKLMCERYPDNAKIFAYLAGSLTHYGRPVEAEPLFARALELRPDLPEARTGTALAHIRAGRLDEARRLLDFMEKPGAAQLYSLSPLEKLALAYQNAGRHQEALALFGRLQAELPNISQHKGFRKNVKKSEAAVGAGTSILPKYKFTLKGLFQSQRTNAPGAGTRSVSNRTALIILACVLALIAAGFIVANENVRRHRTLYVANQFGPELHLEISGIGPVQLRHGINEVSLPEGDYQARFSGPVQEDDHFEIRAGYFHRWTGKPLWLLNPGGAAILVFERAVYSRDAEPVYAAYHYGQRFEVYPEITHPFEELPESVTVDSDVGQKVLTGLKFFRAKPINAVYALEQAKRLPEAAALAEWALPLDPENIDLLEAYLGIPLGKGAVPRMTAFLRAGLTNRPVHIAWHRTYQQLVLEGTNEEALVRQYDDMLRAEPTNSALLYLFGRICGDHARAAGLFVQSHEADAKNPFPIYAMGYDQMLAGNWPEAKTLMSQASALAPDDAQFRAGSMATRIALGEYEAVEGELRSELKQNPTDLKVNFQLCEVLAAEGKRADGEKAVDDLGRAYQTEAPESAPLIRALTRYHWLYAAGDFKALETAGKSAGRPAAEAAAGKTAMFWALIEQHRLDDGVKMLKPDEVGDIPTFLGAMLAFRMTGRADEARPWQEALVKILRVGDRRNRLAADLLEGTAAPTPETLDNLSLAVKAKAALLANLAWMHPESRAQLNGLAQKLNVERSFPYYLIQRSTSVGAVQ